MDPEDFPPEPTACPDPDCPTHETGEKEFYPDSHDLYPGGTCHACGYERAGWEAEGEYRQDMWNHWSRKD